MKDKDRLLVEALLEDNSKKMQHLIEQGADVNAIIDETVDHQNYLYAHPGNTVLMLASSLCNFECTNVLIQHGANTYYPGEGPLTAALMNDEDLYLDFIKFLLDNGANINEKDSNNHTPVMHLIDKLDCTNTPIIEYLLDRCADLSGGIFDYALEQAQMLDRQDVIRLLQSAAEKNPDLTAPQATNVSVEENSAPGM